MLKKSLVSILLLVVEIYLFISSNYLVVQKHEKNANEISELLSPKYFSNKVTGKQYTVFQIIEKSNPIYKRLEEKGIISKQSYFSYTSVGCISLIF